MVAGVASIFAGSGVSGLLKLMGITSAATVGGQVGGQIAGSIGSRGVALGAAAPIGFAGGAGYGLGIRAGFEQIYAAVKAGHLSIADALQLINEVSAGGAPDIGATFAGSIKSPSSVTGSIGSAVQGPALGISSQTIADDKAQRQFERDGKTLSEVTAANVAALNLDQEQGRLDYLRTQRDSLNASIRVVGTKRGAKRANDLIVFANGASITRNAYSRHVSQIKKELSRINSLITSMKSQYPTLN